MQARILRFSVAARPSQYYYGGSFKPYYSCRAFSTSPSNKDEKRVNVKNISAGLPDWIEHWDRGTFHKVGYGLAAVSVASFPLLQDIFVTIPLIGVTSAYWIIGLRDIRQPQQTIRRNFPVLGNMRYLMEMIRPEVCAVLIHGTDY